MTTKYDGNYRGCVARALVFTLTFSVFLSRLASAQTPPSAELPAVHAGQKVWVTTVDGKEVQGRVESVSPAEIRVLTHQNITPIRLPEVRLIETPDSVRNGVVKGAIIGGLAGGIPMALFMVGYGECPCSNGRQVVAGYAARGALIGAGIGLLADSLREGRHQVYKAPPLVSVAPMFAPGKIAVNVGLRW